MKGFIGGHPISEEVKYEYEDPSEFILDCFSFREKNKTHYPRKHWETMSLINVGVPGSGKSTKGRYCGKLMSEVYEGDFQAIETNDIVYALSYLNLPENIESRKKNLFIHFDDALSNGMDSRTSMTGANIQASQTKALERHLLANEDKYHNPDPRVKEGFCVMLYSVQFPSGLDLRIKNTSVCSFWSSFYPDLFEYVRKYKLDPEYTIRFLQAHDRKARIKKIYSERSECLGIDCTGMAYHFKFPDVSFDFTQLIPPPERYMEIVNELMQFDLADVSDGVLKGYLSDYAASTNITLTDNDVIKLIQKAKYYQWKKGRVQQNTTTAETFNTLIDLLKSNYSLNEMAEPVLRGFLLTQARLRELTLSQSDMKDLIQQARYQQYEERKKRLQESPAEQESQLTVCQRMKLIDTMRALDPQPSFRYLASIFGVTEQTLHEQFKKWKRKQKETTEVVVISK